MTAKEKKDRAADLRLRRTYGITLSQYNAILKYQDNRCAICRRSVKEFKTRLAVDHCHTTGLVRGLCCWGCNKAIAVFRDSVERLKNAAGYLTNPPFTMVFGPLYTAPGRIGTKKREKLLAAMRLAAGVKSK